MPRSAVVARWGWARGAHLRMEAREREGTRKVQVSKPTSTLTG